MKAIKENAKQEYHRPKLQDYGNIQQVTATTGGGAKADTAMGTVKT